MSVGQSVIRKDAEAKVTGRSLYVEDMKPAGMLYGGIVRSPYAAAKIKSIDKSAAFEMKGVYAVLTASDIPGENVVSLVNMDMPVLPADEVRFDGEPVALVAAENKDILEEAINAVKVEFEEIEPISDPEETLKSGARIINPQFENNVLSEYSINKGKDIDEAFKECDYVVEERYETPHQEHAYIETQGMLAVPNPDGSMVVYGSMQCPFYILDGLSTALNIPRAKIRVIQAATGGAFGGKEDVPSIVAIQAALLAYHTERPVRVVYTREEDMRTMSKRHPGVIYYKSGIKKDGTLHAVEVDYILNGGAYSTLSPIVLWRGAVHSVGPYKCPNVKSKSRASATNTVSNGAYRGFGTPQIIFAIESQMDLLAEKAGISPLEIRLKNGIRVGDETATGHKLTESVGFIETLEAAAKDMNFADKYVKYKNQSKDSKKRKGIGIGCLIYGVGLGAGGKHLARAGAFLQIHKDGSVQVAAGNTEMGQGYTTVACQITASALGVKYDKVHMLPIDTSRVPDSGPTVASRGTFMTGNAVIDAAKVLKQRILEQASKLLGESADKLDASDGKIFVKENPSKSIDYQEAVDECFANRVHMAAQGWTEAPFTSYDNGQGDAYFCYTFASNVTEVEVDTETGEVKILKIASAYDIKPVNPQLVEGQIHGGVTQGLGYGLYEGLILNNGKIQNNAFSTYIIPTIKDTPKINPILVPKEYSKGPFGIKGFGEPPLMAVAPSISNAVRNASGKAIKTLPVSPEKILGMD